MVWPWTLTFRPKNIIRSSVSQDAPVTKVWRKSINRYWSYSGNMKIWDAFGHAVTLNLTFWPQNLISSSLSPDAPVTKVWRKSVNRYWRYRGNKTTTWITDGRMDGCTHGRRHRRTTRKHIASAGAYRRQRLKKFCCIAAVCTSAIQLQYKKNILVLQLYCSCIALAWTALQPCYVSALHCSDICSSIYAMLCACRILLLLLYITCLLLKWDGKWVVAFWIRGKA